MAGHLLGVLEPSVVWSSLDHSARARCFGRSMENKIVYGIAGD
jgi:hypothetical protein